MKRIEDRLQPYDIDKVKNDFYFTEAGRQNAIDFAIEYNKKIKLGEVNNDLKYLNYIQGILIPYIFNEKYNDKKIWWMLRHKFYTNKYSMITESYKYLRKIEAIDDEIVKEIESALSFVIFRYDKCYTNLEIDAAEKYFYEGRQWLEIYLNNKGKTLC